ncbi:putative tbc domain [Phaeomoniella chlamydospora]|uniref:Putative tbc domain n=1 Tax=Phaeomoniella chlamydospora TaxID=158046 RepID=A0A0G2GWD8_PHACM|nr:putative tbc domain [Phaeomoniella chlamydospora]
MRSIGETRKKWATLFSDEAIGLDLREAVRETEAPNPCEEGLRSICWKAFLLYGPPSQSSWPKKLAESRNAYTSLRAHFLRYIEHPDDLQSNVDPLADDHNSPWATLRQDEVNRAEIFQDVERCLQENFFFREPRTQKILLDILFIYSKLHPDIGYRQGMHELLAPIVWVIERDAVDLDMDTERSGKKEEEHLMTLALDSQYIEHDAFSLFCAVMQTMKSFYELGETNASSPIVNRSVKIHDGLLTKIDPELAEHLQSIEILPQIFLIEPQSGFDRYDMCCDAIADTMAIQVLQADYSSALTLLLRYPPPKQPFGPSSLVRDAILLDRDKSASTGATLIGRYTGRKPEVLQHLTTNEEIKKRVKYLEDRNKALGKMLSDALEELRLIQAHDSETNQTPTENSLNIALAKIQFVQVYLEDSEIPIPPPVPVKETSQQQIIEAPLDQKASPLEQVATNTAAEEVPTTLPSVPLKTMINETESQYPASDISSIPPPRPSLAQSSFSWMLGEDRHRSSFVSSVTVPPEQRRDSDAKNRPKQLFADTKKEEGRKESESSEDNGFTMSSLRGRVDGQ